MVLEKTKARYLLVVITSLIFILTSASNAEIVYEWVPDRTSGGSGFIRFDENFIAASDDGTKHFIYTDDANFITEFSNPPVLEFSFTFGSGLTIDDVSNFSSASTIQTQLASTQFQASNGIIDGWSFEYTHSSQLLPPHSYQGTSVSNIFCVTLPCPQLGAHVMFSGVNASENHEGFFRLVIPEPSTMFFGTLSGLAILTARRRNAT